MRLSGNMNQPDYCAREKPSIDGPTYESLPGEIPCNMSFQEADAFGNPRNTASRRSWQEFRETGLLMLANQFLHIFGWAICIDYDSRIDRIVDVYPARVTFRGFGPQSIERAYKKVTQYMKQNADALLAEVNED